MLGHTRIPSHNIVKGNVYKIIIINYSLEHLKKKNHIHHAAQERTHEEDRSDRWRKEET